MDLFSVSIWPSVTRIPLRLTHTDDIRFGVGIPVLHKTPEFLEKTGYKNPTDPKDVAFQYAKDYQGDMFDYFTSHPREGASFNHVMGGVMAHQAG